MVAIVCGEKYAIKVSVCEEQLLCIESNSTVIPKTMYLKTRSAVWFSSERCPMSRVDDVSDLNLSNITELRVGYEDMGILSNKSNVRTNMTYAISNFNRNKIYYIEYPKNFERRNATPATIWVYIRPKHMAGHPTTKPEVINCLHAFKLSGFAEQQVGLNSFGQPKSNKEVYTSFENYKKWTKRSREASTKADTTDTSEAQNSWYYIVGGILSTLSLLLSALVAVRRRMASKAPDPKIGEGSPYKQLSDAETFLYDSRIYETPRNLTPEYVSMAAIRPLPKIPEPNHYDVPRPITQLNVDYLK